MDIVDLQFGHAGHLILFAERCVSYHQDVKSMSSSEAPSRRRLRLWPGVIIAAALWLTRFGAPMAGTTTEFLIRVLGGFVGALAVLVWWVGFSRAPWRDRGIALAAIVAAVAATAALADPSMVVWLLWYAPAVLTLALVAGAAAGRNLGDRGRSVAMIAAIALPCAAAMPLRIAGVAGNGVAAFEWRWTETSEQRLLARADDEPAGNGLRNTAAVRHDAGSSPPPNGPLAASADAVTPAPGVVAASEPAPALNLMWAGFRGAERDGVIPGVRIETDWSATGPALMWRRSVGPGWASFAVRGDVLYTQEQRGPEEVVSAYRVLTGEPVWRHRDRARLDDPMGGPGPRATPTLGADHVYTFGSTGILNALDPGTGTIVWSRNAASDLNAAIPTWGYSSSPLVVDDLVIVAVGGTLAAYGRSDGRPRWVGPAGGDSYSSPQAMAIEGVTQVVLMDTVGTVSVAPATGKSLWTYPWNARLPVMPIVQPARLEDGGVLLGDSTFGIRRLAATLRDQQWTVTERWASSSLKPYFNDFVVHRGHAFGFDGSILASVDLADGARKWKAGRYGQGQLVLLPDQDLLLVVSEEGELALVRATPDRFTELARVPALAGKTWNHPALVGDILLVRNGEEMAAFRLGLERR
jgi:outer membrane protein assembly factor BamB